MSVNDDKIIREQVQLLLRNAQLFHDKWTVQGLGMMRIYYSRQRRLHIWLPKYATPGSSTTHTHPWDFHSKIVVGSIKNTRYLPCLPTDKNSELFEYQVLHCGVGIDESFGGPHTVSLKAQPAENLVAGDGYYQGSDEIHESAATVGTVSIINRTHFRSDDRAKVFWRKDKEKFSTTAARPATRDEIEEFSKAALVLF